MEAMLAVFKSQKKLLRQSIANCRKQALIVTLFSILITSCSNSEFVLNILYKRLDDRINDSILKYGGFSNQQTVAFNNSVGTFHTWHRQTQLPEYASLLLEISTSIAESGQTTDREIKQWVEQISQLRQAMLECHPVNFSIELMRTLSDKQLDTIEQGLAKDRNEHRKKRIDKTAEQRIESQFNKMKSWASRANIRLNDKQRQLLRNTLSQQKRAGTAYRQRLDQWYTELFNTVRDQGAADFHAKIKTLFDRRWALWEDSSPEIRQYNRELWQRFSVQLIESLTDVQRRNFARWSSILAGNIKSISRRKPEFQTRGDPTVGCLVGDT